MAYTVLARRYRSRAFDEVIGQEPIAKTLQNAVATGRVAHAYLFCGTRGVGKTTVARLFAVALNGGSPEVDAAIMSGQDTDTIEIDAASNTGVDNVRELIANAAYRPMRGKYKVYIIDEVHMLSTSAFNALLKTMEEPPEHVKFILCTTDPQKVPATIQSRCQRYDFRNIPASLIAKHLADVVKQEGLAAEPELLHEVARLGNGSMRDALSLMDRVIAGGEKKLTLKHLNELLGLPDRALVGSLIDALADGKPGPALDSANSLLQRGISIDQVIETLLGRLRDLMILSACGGQTSLVDLSDDSRAEEVARAARFDAAGLVHMIALCENVQRAAKNSAVPRALLDALIVRLAMTEKLADVTAIVSGAGNGAAPAKTLTPASPPRVATSPATPANPASAGVPDPGPPPPAVSNGLGGDDWSRVVDAAQANLRLRVLINDCRLVEVKDDAVVLAVGDTLMAAAMANEKELCDLLARAWDRAVRIEFRGNGAPDSPPPAHDPAAARAAVGEHPLVKQAIELFGARLVGVQPRRKE